MVAALFSAVESALFFISCDFGAPVQLEIHSCLGIDRIEAIKTRRPVDAYLVSFKCGPYIGHTQCKKALVDLPFEVSLKLLLKTVARCSVAFDDSRVAKCKVFLRTCRILTDHRPLHNREKSR